MNQKEILKMIKIAVKQSQENSGRAVPDLDGSSRLVGDVPGCDSLVLEELALELTIALFDSLGEREIPASLFKGSHPQKQPTLDEITSRIEKYIAKEQNGDSTSVMLKNGGPTSINDYRSVSSSKDLTAQPSSNGARSPSSPQDNQLP